MSRRLNFSQKQSRVIGYSLLVSLALVIIPVALAQDSKADSSASGSVSSEEVVRTKSEKEVEKVKTGTIANTGTFVSSGAVDVQTAGASPGDAKSPITGSITPEGRRRCLATVKNSSKENAYSVRFKVQAKNDRGTKTVNKSFSARLSPGASTSRTFTCDPDDSMSVILSSATKIGG